MYKNKYISVLLLILISLMLSACEKENKNNPVTPPETLIIDSNLFDWKIDIMYNHIPLDLYIADTNQIIIPSNPYSVYWNNGKINYINHNDNDFSANCADGTDINNVYIGGETISDRKPKLKRWNGSTIEDIPLPADTSNEICSIISISENDVWMSTLRNIIYHYQNGLFTKYKLDSINTNGQMGGMLFKDNFNSLFALATIRKAGNYYSYYIYKYYNNSWKYICEDSVNITDNLVRL